MHINMGLSLIVVMALNDGSTLGYSHTLRIIKRSTFTSWLSFCGSEGLSDLQGSIGNNSTFGMVPLSPLYNSVGSSP